MEPGKLAGPAREDASSCSIDVGEINSAVAEGDVVARPWGVEDDVTVEEELGTGGAEIGDSRADLDLLQGRGCDSAEVIGPALVGVGRARLGHPENPASLERG